MKKQLLIFGFLFICSYLAAQVTEGAIIYEQTELKSKDIEGMTENPELAAMMGNKKAKKSMLLFTNEESLYNLYDNRFEEKSDMKTSDDGSMFITVTHSAPEDIIYSNLTDKKQLKQQELLGKKFLVSSNITTVPWKLQPDRKEILGYSCIKATYTNSTDTLTAWFSPQIPVAIGPKHYGQLPGLILEMEIKNQNTKLTAIDVKKVEVTTEMLEQPKKGKKVSKERFEKIEADKKAEQEKYQKKGGGNFYYGGD